MFSALPEHPQPRDRFDKPPPQVRVTGYFFKIQRYEVQEGDDQNHRAPLILAKRIQVLNSSATQSRELGLAPYVIGFALVLGAILAFTMWRLSVGDKQFAETQLKRFDTTNTADLSGLEQLDASDDPADFFRRMSDPEPASPPAPPPPPASPGRTRATP